jgi:hypothetical protein
MSYNKIQIFLCNGSWRNAWWNTFHDKQFVLFLIRYLYGCSEHVTRSCHPKFLATVHSKEQLICVHNAKGRTGTVSTKNKADLGRLRTEHVHSTWNVQSHALRHRMAHLGFSNRQSCSLPARMTCGDPQRGDNTQSRNSIQRQQHEYLVTKIFVLLNKYYYREILKHWHMHFRVIYLLNMGNLRVWRVLTVVWNKVLLIFWN